MSVAAEDVVSLAYETFGWIGGGHFCRGFGWIWLVEGVGGLVMKILGGGVAEIYRF